MKRLVQLVSVLVVILFVVKSSLAIAYTITGFRGIEFGKTVAFYEKQGIKFTDFFESSSLSHFKKRVDDKLVLGDVPLTSIQYIFEENGGGLSWVAIETIHVINAFDSLKKTLFLKYGKTKLVREEFFGMRSNSYRWTLEGGEVRLTHYLIKDNKIALVISSQKYLDELKK
jgi:hypothetical protein